MSRKTTPAGPPPPGFTPGPRHKVFGISDDLLNTTRNILMGVRPEAEESEEEADENKQALAENKGRFVKHTNPDYDSLGHPIKPLPIPKKKKKPTDAGWSKRANMDKNEALSHNCANHVKSEQWGDGQCIPGMHTIEEISEEEGVVTHYDVMFEHGIEEDVPVEDLEIVSEKHHSHKKSMKENDDDDDDNGNGDDDENGNGKSKKKSKKSKKLDKVDPDELEGSHDERDDEDIDNDDDVDASDKYLHKRRKAIHKATKKDA